MSIYAHLLSGGEGPLPDEERVRGSSGISWAPGARDGVAIYHIATYEDPELQQSVIGAIQLCLDTPSWGNRSRLTELLADAQVLSIIDGVLTHFSEDHRRVQQLHGLVRWLTTESPDRELVKLGIGFIGVLSGFKEEPDRALLDLFGRHDEFTLFVILAMRAEGRHLDVWSLFELAQQVHGWGRIHAVRYLEHVEAADIQAWMLREGYRNSIMTEYLAYTCATTGELIDALEASDVDEELLTGAADLIKALIDGGPARDMSDYENGSLAVRRYLDHISTRVSGDLSLEHLLTVETIRKAAVEYLPLDEIAAGAADELGLGPE